MQHLYPESSKISLLKTSSQHVATHPLLKNGTNKGKCLAVLGAQLTIFAWLEADSVAGHPNWKYV